MGAFFLATAIGVRNSARIRARRQCASSPREAGLALLVERGQTFDGVLRREDIAVGLGLQGKGLLVAVGADEDALRRGERKRWPRRRRASTF